MTVAPVTIAGHRIGPGHPTVIVAEISGNHGGSLQAAIDLIGEAKRAGAQLVKTQTYTPEDMTADFPTAPFRITNGPWKDQTLWELYGKAQTPREWITELWKAGDREGIPVFTAPFSVKAFEDYHTLAGGYPAWKIASFEIAYRRLLDRLTESGSMPVIASTGMATFAEIDRVVELFAKNPHQGLVLMRCVSAYPANGDEVRPWLIPVMERVWGVPVGFSDHTLPGYNTLDAVRFGARMIERHIALPARKTVDSHFSLVPNEFAAMVQDIRDWEAPVTAPNRPGLEDSLSDADAVEMLQTFLGPTPGEESSRIFRRGLWFVRPVKAYERVGPEDIRELRPEYDHPHVVSPWDYSRVVGRRVTHTTEPGEPVIWDWLT